MSAHLDDSVISAAVDGQAGAQDVEHLEQCPECRRRLAMFEAAAAAVGLPPSPPPPGQADVAVRRALASGVAVDGDRTTAMQTGWHRRRQVLGAVASAAVIMAVIAGLVVLVRSNPARRSASTSAGPAQSAAGSQAGTAAPSAAAGSGTSAPSGAARPSARPSEGRVEAGQLGDFSDPGQLTGALRAALAGRPPALSTPGSSATPPSCAQSSAAAAGVPANTTPRLSAGMTWRGQPSVVSVYQKPGAHLSAAVIATRGCAILLVLTL